MQRTFTILGIFAHPDDESFGPGGTLARYAAEGAAVHVIIATDGIAGSVEDPAHLLSHDTLAQVRSAELANAAVALGIQSIWSLPYRDSGMRGTADNDHPKALVQQPVAETTQEVLAYIQRLRPDVIITHDPYGGYGHPDHIRVCEVVTDAFYQARRVLGGPRKLYYTAFDKRLLKLVVRLMPLLGQDPRGIGRNKDIDLVEISSWETAITTRIDVSAYRSRRDAASRAHASQYGGGPAFMRLLPGFLQRRITGHDSFTRAFPPAIGGPMESDLLADLRRA